MVENLVIPHLEALVRDYLESERKGCDSPFNFSHALMKMGVLYEKHAIVRFDLNIAVDTY